MSHRIGRKLERVSAQRDIAWCIVMEFDEEDEKRQTSLSFFRWLQFFSKDAGTSCEEIRGSMKHESFGGKMSQSYRRRVMQM